jgi:surface protein
LKMIIFKNFSITIVVILLTFILSCDNNISDISDIADDDSSVFRTKWEIEQWEIEKGLGSVRLPLVKNGRYNFTVYWGDGTKDRIKSWDDPAATHTYENPGIYNVLIKGTIIGWECSYRCRKLIEISNWGTLAFGDTKNQFKESRYLVITAKDAPDLSKTKSLSGAFYNTCLKTGSFFNTWNVSNITDMSEMFYGSQFNGDISNWDVSSVTNMKQTFANSQFNGDIANWDVSRVTNMTEMFSGSQFNGDISNWNVSKVGNMSGMFGISQFNGDISNWNVSNVIYMSGMFGNSQFNGDISNWNVLNVTDMSGMFSDSKFNGDISNWDVSRVIYMSGMFSDSKFNGDISGWDVSKVRNMNGMFRRSVSFNQDISGWDVSRVTDMGGMFSGTGSFDQDISGWDVSKVTNMTGVFASSQFNGNISSWDVSNVIHMTNMFYDMTLSTDYYDEMLIKWSKLSLKHGVVFGAGNLKYSAEAIEARTKIITEFNWTIFDGGLKQ